MQDKVEIRIAGGMSEVGAKNGVVIACDGYGLPIDWGQKIPEFGSTVEHKDMMEKFGAVLPDDYYPDIKQLDGLRVEALCLTHGHQDHTEGWWKLREKYPDIEIITDIFTHKIIAMRAAKGERIGPDWVLHGENVEVGPFTVRRFSVNHSIYGASGFLIEAKGRRMVHPGDVKAWPIRAGEEDRNGELFASLEPEKGIDVLFLDATNVEEEGFVIAEETVEEKIASILYQNRFNRIFFTTISSNVRRLESLINAANEQGRYVFVAGGSPRDFLELAGVNGWEPIFQPYERYEHGKPMRRRYLVPYPSLWPDDAVICVSGSQGEPMSFLDNWAENRFSLPSKPGDTLIVSQDTIPLPEIEARFAHDIEQISSRVDTIHVTCATPPLESQGAEIIQDDSLHSSGHGKRGDQRMWIQGLRPRIVIPCHADRARREMLAYFVEEWGDGWGCKAVLLDDGERLKI